MIGYNQVKDNLAAKGYQLLGMGLFSDVYSHPKHDDIAIKVSKEIDTWPEYVAWATENGYAGTYAPKVYSLKQYSAGFYVAVMERLVETIGKIRYEYMGRGLSLLKNPLCELSGYRLAESEYSGLAEFAKHLNQAGFGGDLHDGNIMIRRDGQIVVTDPSSRNSNTRILIRRGVVFRI